MPVSQTSCPDAAELDRFLREQLDDDQQARVAAHIDGCPECVVVLDALCAANATHGVLAAGEDCSTQQHERTTSLDDDAAAVSDLRRRLKDEPWWVRNPATPQQSRDESDEPDLQFPGPPNKAAPLGTLGDYGIQRHLGSGATGHLYQAVDRKLNRVVAIKVLRSELALQSNARARFEREARAVAQLNDRRIVMLHEVNTDDGFPPWIVMEFVDGESLEDFCRRERNQLRPDDAARMLVEIAEALAVAHAAGVVHRDVKPANVLIAGDTGTLKLADFGLARFDDQPIDLTSDGMLAGTPAYMSPEQIINPQSVTASTDLYSAGVVLYELLTGQLPFRGAVRMVLEQVMHDEPTPPRRLDDRVPRDLETICLKALSKEPERRYASAGDFRDDLLRYLHGEPVRARPVLWPERITRWCRRNPVVSGLVGILVMLGLTGISGWAHHTISTTTTNEQLRDSNDSLVRTNRNLEDARERAAIGEATARANARLAERQLNVAFELITGMVSNVQDELADRPDLTALRQRLIEHAMTGLDKVAESTTSEQTLTVSRAIAENRLGDTFRDLNSFDRALQHYDAADRLLRELLDRDVPADQPAAPSSRAEMLLAVTHSNRGDLFALRDDPQQAAKAYRLALELASRAAESLPDDVAIRQNQAVVLERSARLAAHRGDTQRAADLLQRCLETLRVCQELAPDDLDILESRVHAALQLASLSDNGRLSAQNELESLGTALDDAIKAGHSSVSAQHTLAIVNLQRAETAAASNSQLAELLSRNCAAQLGELFAQQQSSGQPIAGLDVTQARCGGLLLRLGFVEPAREQLDLAYEQMQQWRPSETRDFADLQAAAECLISLCWIERRTGRDQQASLLHAQASRLLDRIAPLCKRSDTRADWLSRQRNLSARLSLAESTNAE